MYRLKKIAVKKHRSKGNRNRLVRSTALSPTFEGGDGKRRSGPSYELTYKDGVDILEIIDHTTPGELHLELGDLKLTVVKR